VNGTVSNCLTPTQIETLLNKGKFSLAIVNTVLDFKNYDDPIQYVIDDSFHWEFYPNIRKKTELFIRKNQATFKDEILQSWSSKNSEFFQVIDSKDSFESVSTEGDVLSIYWRYDKVSDVYERKVYTLGDLLGQAGGFFGSLIAIGSLFLSIFSSRLFVSSILKKIYQIDTWQERERLDPDLKENNKDYLQNRSFIYKDDGRRVTKPYTQSEKFHADTLKTIKKFTGVLEDSQDELKDKEKMKDGILDECEQSMRERRILRYGYSDIFHYLLCCVV